LPTAMSSLELEEEDHRATVEMDTIRATGDCDTIEDLLGALGGKVAEETVVKFKGLLNECCITSLVALRHFTDSLPALSEELFDTSSTMGKLKSQGFVAAVRVRGLRSTVHMHVAKLHFVRVRAGTCSCSPTWDCGSAPRYWCWSQMLRVRCHFFRQPAIRGWYFSLCSLEGGEDNDAAC